MAERLRFPIGVQSFEELRTNGYVYIDKTSYFEELFRNKYYFLSRPRRFGKSLLLSTLEAYFKGKKNLFPGLAVSKWEMEWLEYPVVHIDFNIMSEEAPERLILQLENLLFEAASDYGIEELKDQFPHPAKDDIGPMFAQLVKLLYIKFQRQVVILIDEYDKGLLATLQDADQTEKAAASLRPFFNVLKSSDRYIKFAFVTGVSRFRNTTLFSGANNLLDISLDKRFASLLGISQQELEEYFGSAVANLAASCGWERPLALEVLRDKYDGYRFTSAEEYVYNPFSLMCALNTGQLDDYWVSTGSSRSLAKYLKDSRFTLEELTTSWVAGNELGSTYSQENPLSLFFQTGYLTIDGFRGKSSYHLGIPNQEVQAALAQLVIPEFVKGDSSRSIAQDRLTLEKALEEGDVDKMMNLLRGMLASVPYHEIEIDAMEKHMHLCLYIIFLMMGADARCETAGSAGRLDMVVQTPWRVYVFEFKLDGSPEEALRQIEEKGYAIPWEARGREVIKIGVEFSSTLRTISRWLIRK